MGLLDEAIREHLELKRRRGTDPSEIDRLEREALGPVRRSPQDSPDALLDEEGLVGGVYPEDEEGPYLEAAPEWSDAGEEPGPFDSPSEHVAEDPAADAWAEAEPPTEIAPPAPDEYDLEPDTGVHEAEPAPRSYEPPRHHEIAEEWEAHEREGLAAEPAGFEVDEPAPAPPAPRPASGFEQETVEHDVEAEELHHPDAPEDQEGEDMLEETPDFLQDTPDHDRLWFEQRPPRDFDFDG